MRRILVIQTAKQDSIAKEMAALQANRPDQIVECADLTQAAPDYDALLDAIFDADSVQVY